MYPCIKWYFWQKRHKCQKAPWGVIYKARIHWETTQIDPKVSKTDKNPILTHFWHAQKVQNIFFGVFVKTDPKYQKCQKSDVASFTTLEYIEGCPKSILSVKMTQPTHFWKKLTLMTLLIRRPSTLISDSWSHLHDHAQKWQKWHKRVKSDKPQNRVIYKARIPWETTQIDPKVSKTDKNPILTHFWPFLACSKSPKYFFWGFCQNWPKISKMSKIWCCVIYNTRMHWGMSKIDPECQNDTADPFLKKTHAHDTFFKTTISLDLRSMISWHGMLKSDIYGLFVKIPQNHSCRHCGEDPQKRKKRKNVKIDPFATVSVVGYLEISSKIPYEPIMTLF